MGDFPKNIFNYYLLCLNIQMCITANGINIQVNTLALHQNWPNVIIRLCYNFGQLFQFKQPLCATAAALVQQRPNLRCLVASINLFPLLKRIGKQKKLYRASLQYHTVKLQTNQFNSILDCKQISLSLYTNNRHEYICKRLYGSAKVQRHDDGN